MRPARIVLAALSALLLSTTLDFTQTRAADPRSRISVSKEPNSLEIHIGGQPFASYVYRDEKILRPYFAHVKSPAGIQVTRNHPPREGIDPTDHAEMHPGIWLAFGDISGADFWRNRARVEHVEFVAKPTTRPGRLSFTVRNRYLADGKVICTELCRHAVLVRPAGYLLIYDSQFRSEQEAFYFGDQEELGLGVRVASALRVKGGNGEMLAADGKRNERQIRGSTADWVDYRGSLEDHRVGMTLMPDPRNFRRSWYHARDYGFITANPFGRHALTGREKSQVVVATGETLRLRFGVLIHASPSSSKPLDIPAAYADYLQQLK